MDLCVRYIAAEPMDHRTLDATTLLRCNGRDAGSYRSLSIGDGQCRVDANRLWCDKSVLDFMLTGTEQVNFIAGAKINDPESRLSGAHIAYPGTINTLVTMVISIRPKRAVGTQRPSQHTPGKMRVGVILEIAEELW